MKAAINILSVFAVKDRPTGFIKALFSGKNPIKFLLDMK
jgi:hypothetical protein